CSRPMRASARKRPAERCRSSIPIRRRRKRRLARSRFQPLFALARHLRDSVVHAPRKIDAENVFRVFQRAFSKLTTAETRFASHASYGLRQRFRTSRQWILPMPFTEVVGT